MKIETLQEAYSYLKEFKPYGSIDWMGEGEFKVSTESPVGLYVRKFETWFKLCDSEVKKFSKLYKKNIKELNIEATVDNFRKELSFEIDNNIEIAKKLKSYKEGFIDENIFISQVKQLFKKSDFKTRISKEYDTVDQSINNCWYEGKAIDYLDFVVGELFPFIEEIKSDFILSHDVIYSTLMGSKKYHKVFNFVSSDTTKEIYETFKKEVNSKVKGITVPTGRKHLIK